MPKSIFAGTWTCLLISTALLLLSYGCAIPPQPPRYELSSVTDSPSGVHLPGTFIWNDLLTDDVEEAKQFYGQLFGWTFEEMPEYTLVRNNGQRIASIIQRRESSEQGPVARWLSNLSVPDVDSAAAYFVEAGGTILDGPLDIIGRGRGALVRDPQGAQLVLLRSSSGDPQDAEPVIGSWLWHELWSNSAEESLSFYQHLCGYDSLQGDSYFILQKNEQWRAGIRVVVNPELEMRWVPVVRVADTEDVVTRAIQLGGEVLVEPMPNQIGSVALIADPAEALLIVQRWSTAPSEQE